MKNLTIIFGIVLSTTNMIAQNNQSVSNDSLHNEQAISQNALLSNFALELSLKENFKYRDFLRKAKKHQEIIELGQQTFTKETLLKRLRKGAIRSKNLSDFEACMITEIPLMMDYFSDDDKLFLYQNLREGSFNKYMDELALDF